MPRIRDYLTPLLIAVPVVLLDQGSKFLVRTLLPYGVAWSPWPWLMPFVRIVHWGNTGVAFGMFQGGGDFFTLLAVVVVLVIFYLIPRLPREDRLLHIVIGLMLGGAVGNLIDRLTIGHVTDFIALGSFPVFNLADASISIGAATLIIATHLREKRQQTESPSSQALHD